MAEKVNSGKTGGAYTGFTTNRRIGTARTKEITTVEDFVIGYRNREDISLLKPQTLVVGSHDVLTNVSGRVGSRKGYTIDGAASNVQSPAKSPFTWLTQRGQIWNTRAVLLTSAVNDGRLQFRYTDSSGTVSWLDLLTGLSSTSFNYVNFWDSTNVRAVLLMVNGSGGIWEWTGAVGTVSSTTATTIVLSGTSTTAQLGFYSSGSIIANGTTYTYSGVSGETLTGVSPNPTGLTATTPVYQAPVFTAVGSMTFTTTPTPPSGFTFDLISQLNNQVFFGSLTSNLLYMSKAGTYKDYSQSAARLQYEGEQFTTQGSLKCLIPEDEALYVSAGLDEWYQTSFVETTITSAITDTTSTFEDATLKRLKTTSGQASQSQAFTTKIKNNIVFLSNEPIVNSLGTVQNFLASPQIVDLSFSIVNDINAYDFTDGSIFYYKQFVYLAVPKEGLYRVYNMTNPKNPYWEAPITIPLSGFAYDGNTILGHSYLTSESYILNNGYTDRAVNINTAGNPISCEAVFAFQEAGIRSKRKSFNKFFIEGYMSVSTIVTIGLTYRAPGNGITPAQTFTIEGNQPYVLQLPDNSLGKNPLGSSPLGSDLISTDPSSLPNYFAVIKTFTRYPYLSYQPSFSSYGLNQRWELLAYGNNASPTSEIENDITY